MNLYFRTEKWAPFYQEAKPLMDAHWCEIAIDQDVIPLALDEARYQSMEDSGILHLLTARDAGKLVGYYIAFILPHVHYSTSGKMAFTDIYFMDRDYRRGMSGVRLFQQAELTLREAGVTKIYLSTKVKHDCGEIFERLGFELSDRVFTKCFLR